MHALDRSAPRPPPHRSLDRGLLAVLVDRPGRSGGSAGRTDGHVAGPPGHDAVVRDHGAPSGRLRRWVERHGIPPIGSGLALGHLLVLEGEPDRAATTAYLEAMDYVVARLTGTISATQHSMFMSQLCDNRTLGATAYDPELLDMADVDPARLPPLVPVGTTVGTIRPDLAERLGLPARAEVSAGTNDTSTDAVATGALECGTVRTRHRHDQRPRRHGRDDEGRPGPRDPLDARAVPGPVPGVGRERVGRPRRPAGAGVAGPDRRRPRGRRPRAAVRPARHRAGRLAARRQRRVVPSVVPGRAWRRGATLRCGVAS